MSRGNSIIISILVVLMLIDTAAIVYIAQHPFNDRPGVDTQIPIIRYFYGRVVLRGTATENEIDDMRRWVTNMGIVPDAVPLPYQDFVEQLITGKHVDGVKRG
jgi:hypothetical protein